MINSETLRATLKKIYGVEDKYIVPISSNWFTPTIDPTDKIGTWIGYRIMSMRPYVQGYQQGVYKVMPMKVSFRLTFIGPEAEKIAMQTILWDERSDAVAAFAEQNAQLNYKDRTCFTYPVRNEGFNDQMCWIVDFDCVTTYEVDTKQKPWLPRQNI